MSSMMLSTRLLLALAFVLLASATTTHSGGAAATSTTTAAATTTGTKPGNSALCDVFIGLVKLEARAQAPANNRTACFSPGEEGCVACAVSKKCAFW